MTGLRRRQVKVPRLKCDFCTRQFHNTTGLTIHRNSAHIRPQGLDNAAPLHDQPDFQDEQFDFGMFDDADRNNSPDPDIDEEPNDDLMDEEEQRPQTSTREYHPVLDGMQYHCYCRTVYLNISSNRNPLQRTRRRFTRRHSTSSTPPP